MDNMVMECDCGSSGYNECDSGYDDHIWTSDGDGDVNSQFPDHSHS